MDTPLNYGYDHSIEKMMKVRILRGSLLIMLCFLLCCESSFASGWHDYQLDIGDGYSIFRANSLDVGIGMNDGGLILSPRDYEGVGPIVKYSVTEDLIFARNLGRMDRNLFDGDTYQEIDYGKEYYFIILKDTKQVLGPLNKEAFMGKASALGVTDIDWFSLRNPNLLRPLLGDLIFLGLAVKLLAVKYYYIIIPFIALVTLGLLKMGRKLRAKITTTT